MNGYTTKITKVVRVRTMTEYWQWQAFDDGNLAATGKCATKAEAELGSKAFVDFMTNDEQAAMQIFEAVANALEEV